MIKAVSGAIIVTLLAIALILGFMKYQDYKNSLENILAADLYDVLTSYDDFLENYEEQPALSLQYIQNSKVDLEKIQIFSEDLDHDIGYQELGPITEDFLTIMHTIEVEFTNNRELSTNRFDDLNTMLNELKIIVYNNYYNDKDNHHGGQAKLQLNQVEDINEFRDKLDNYITDNKLSISQ
ncbi:hypothetical protein [Radiobacillus sp. PE A8.2]|uniref:hypothetical protein n=1 Tax=Radiobacillus sp. PE A8.2 TaxID=3380349 RepID=UPI0038905E5A